MSEAPEKIIAYNERQTGYSFTAFGPQPHFGPVEYIRADVSAARIADLARQLAEARTDAEQAVALVVKRAEDVCDLSEHDAEERNWRDGAALARRIRKTILALAPTDALADVQRWKTALESIARNTCCDGCQEAALVARAALGATP